MNKEEISVENRQNIQERPTKEIFSDIAGSAKALGSLVRELINKSHAIWGCIWLAFLVNFAVEALCRQSIYECIVYMARHPFSFLYNTLIVLATLCIGVVLKKRYFYYAVICTVWLGLGVTSAVILVYRITPLTAGDFMIARSALGLFDKYLSKSQMILLGVAVFIVICLLILILLHAPKPSDIKRKKGFGFIGAVALLVASTTYFANNIAYSDSDSFASLVKAFDNYGFAYSFSITTFDGGVDKPAYYNEDYMKTMAEEMNAGSPASAPENLPNIIYLQLESFFDVNYIKNYSYSENPIPNFTALKESCPSGFFTVPSIGGGTANTEFEVLTGFNMDYFGAGEYPFKTVMKEKTSESVCYTLKNYGFATHAIHNHTGTFYDRHKVYANLGFDSFTPIEYMYGVEFTPKGWAKDKVLTDEIVKALNSTEGRDFIHAVSVQGHGRYPNSQIDDTQTITMEGQPDAEEKAGFEYYINQLREMDDFIGGLLSTLEAYNEDVVLVLWGDHLPTFPVTDSDLVNGNIYQTEYVIWSNCGISAEDKDIYSYQLTSRVSEVLGLYDGWTTKFHKTYENSPEFEMKFRAMEYDMFYGNAYLWGGTSYEPTQMRMGIEDIAIENCYLEDGKLVVTGGPFNKYSRIMIDGEQKSTKLDENGNLVSKEADVYDGCTITVVQKKATILGETPPFIFSMPQSQPEE